jgi:hypothetical protein
VVFLVCLFYDFYCFLGYLFFGSVKVFFYGWYCVGGFVLGVELFEFFGGYFEVVGCVFYCYVVLLVLL